MSQLPHLTNLTTTVAGIQVENCIWNAAGPRCTTMEELVELARSESGAIVSKSCTRYPREGNVFPRYYDCPTSKLTTNSTGLANLGYEFYSTAGNILHTIAPQKPYFISVSGLTTDDNLHIIRDLHTSPDPRDFQAIELNLSCPNVEGKPQIGYDFPATEELLRRVFEIEGLNQQKPIGLKMPPYLDQSLVSQMAEIVSHFPVRFITCINSLGNGLIIDPITETPVIRPKGGLGGIGGAPIKPFALSNVYMFRRNLPSHIDIIGCGGIITGTDAFEHLLVGATAVQIGSQFMREGTGCFSRISTELKELMISKGYQRISDFQNRF